MIEVLLIGAVIVLAVLAVELEKLLHSAVCLGGMCVAIGILFGLLNAAYVMVFQLLIYSGATMVLFLAVVMLTERTEE